MTQRPAARTLTVVLTLIGFGGLPLPHGDRLLGGGAGILSTARAQIGERPAPRDDRSFLAGNGLMARGLYELAIVEYRAFLKDHPDHESVSDARYALGVALHKTGKHAEAIAELEAIEGTGAGPGSRGSGGKEVGEFAFAMEAKVVRGQAMMALGRERDAARVFASAAREHPAHDLSDDAMMLWVECLVGDGSRDSGEVAWEDVDAASAAFQAAFPANQSPHAARVGYRHAEALAALGRHEECVNAVDRVFANKDERAPEGWDRIEAACRWTRATSLRAMGQGSRAAADLEWVAAQGSENLRAPAWLALAEEHATNSRWDRCAHAASQVRSTNDSDTSLADAATLLAGRAFMELSDLDNAERALSALANRRANQDSARDLQQEKTNADSAAWRAAYLLAKVKLRTGDNKQAAELLETLASVASTSPMAGQTRTGSSGEGRGMEDAAQAAGGLAEVLQDLCVARGRAGDAAGAREASQRLLAAFPDHPLAQGARAMTAASSLNAADYPGALAAAEEYLSRSVKPSSGTAQSGTDAEAAREHGGVVFVRAEALRMMKRDAEAGAAYEEYLSTARTGGDTEHAAAAAARSAEIMAAAGRIDDAKRLLAEMNTLAAHSVSGTRTDANTAAGTASGRGPTGPSGAAPGGDNDAAGSGSIDTASAMRSVGISAYERGDYAGARELLTEYLRSAGGPSSAGIDDGLLFLGLACIRAGDDAAAAAPLKRLAEGEEFAQSPRRAQGMFELGQCFDAMKQHDEAEALFNRVAAEHAATRFGVSSLRRLAASALAAGDAARAEALLARAEEHLADAGKSAGEPGWESRTRLANVFDRAVAMMHQGKYREACSAFDSLASANRSNESDASERVALASRARLRAVVCAAREGMAGLSNADAARPPEPILTQREHAARVFERLKDAIERSNPDNDDREWFSLAHYETGRLMAATGDIAHAEEALSAVMRASRESAIAVSAGAEIARLRSAAGDHAGAGDAARAAAELPAWASANASTKRGVLYTAGSAAFAAEKWESALRWMSECLKISDDAKQNKTSEPAADDVRPWATLLAGECLVKLARHAEARDAFEAFLRARPDDPQAATARLRLMECAAHEGDFPASAAAAQQFLDRHAAGDGSESEVPSAGRDDSAHELVYQARFGLAWALEQMGKPAEAIAHYQRVVESHRGPTAARAQFQIGECRFALKDYERAAAELLKVDILYDAPQWRAAALYEAGRCFEAMGRTREAVEQFTRAAESGQDSWADLASERLAEIGSAAAAARPASNAAPPTRPR